MDANIKASVLRKMTYGLWVLAADHQGDREASTVTWVSQASFHPPLIMVGLRIGSHLHDVTTQAGAFALHLLHAGQKDVAAAFIKPTEVTPERIGGYAFAPGKVTGAPILEGFSCWMEARVVDTVRRGDHAVLIAEVVDAGQSDASAQSLVLATTGWNYGG